MTAALLDHLWQSTLVAGLAALLVLSLKHNSARVRFWLWFAASLKFLVPFAALAALGEAIARLLPVAVIASPKLAAMAPAAEGIAAPATLLAVPQEAAGISIAALLGLVWLAGFAAVLGIRGLRSLRLRHVLRHAQDVDIAAPVKVKTSASLLEPGLVGIVSPVVLLPQGLMARLSHHEIQSILAHELTHLRRRDNLTAAIHMWVEALFWFYPLVWLIGARLITERERACDEGVLAHGHDREVYAGGILKVCKFCLQSPMASMAGVSGGDLGLRVRQIMTAPDAMRVAAPKKAMLAGTALMLLALPVMSGLVAAPLPASVTRAAAAADQALTQGITQGMAAIGLPLTRTIPAPQPLPQLQMASIAAPTAELPSFTVAPWQPQGAPAVAPPPRPVAMAVNESARTASQPVAATPSPAKQVVRAIDPRGEGDPNTVTCRTPQLLPGSRLRGPEVCKTNKVWGELAAKRQLVMPDGRSVVAVGLRSDSCSGVQSALPGALPGGAVKTNFACN